MDTKLKILHLEDLRSDALLIGNALKRGKLNFERIVVDTKKEFIDALHQFKPDIILSDHSLPAFNSHEALIILQESEFKIPFILITANISEEFAVDAIKRGADDYILKDRLERLPSAIYNALEKLRLEKERQFFLEALIKKEKHYRALIENSADAIVILDEKGKQTYVSHSVQKVLGYTDEEAMLLNLLNLLHEDDKEKTAIKITECLQKPGLTLLGHTSRLKHKNGDWIWLEIILTNMLLDPDINGIVGNFRDVTERIHADEKNRFKANLLNTIGQAVVATNLDGSVNYWNKAAEEIFGWTIEEAIGQNIKDLTPIHQTPEQLNQISEKLNQGFTWSGEFRVNRKDGTNFPAFLTDSPIYDGQHQLAGIIRISSDITDKKKLEDLLDKASKMARIGSYEANLIENTLFWSDITKEIHEVDQNFVADIETAMQFYKSGLSQKRMVIALREAREKNIPFDLELQIITANQHERWIRVIGEGEYRDGTCIRLYGSIQDIDKIKRAEIEALKVYEELQAYTKELVISNTELEQFSYIISHNLRAPVANIIGLAEELKDPSHNKEIKEALNDALSVSVKLLDNVIKDLHHILKIKKEITEKKELVNLGEIVENIQSSIRNLIKKEKVQILYDFTGLEEFRTIKSYVHSIFYNLISNSIKYGQPDLPPVITIHAQRVGKKLIITLTDNGIGIDLDKNSTQIFGLYKRFHQHVEGKGMGLFMVKTQVEALGGKITLKSKVNIGTAFKIEIQV